MTTTADVPRESACPTCGSTTTKHEHLPRVPMSGHPLVVAVFPGIPVRIIEAALEHARAHRCELVMAYVDESRVDSFHYTHVCDACKIESRRRSVAPRSSSSVA